MLADLLQEVSRIAVCGNNRAAIESVSGSIRARVYALIPNHQNKVSSHSTKVMAEQIRKNNEAHAAEVLRRFAIKVVEKPLEDRPLPFGSVSSSNQ